MSQYMLKRVLTVVTLLCLVFGVAKISSAHQLSYQELINKTNIPNYGAIPSFKLKQLIDDHMGDLDLTGDALQEDAISHEVFLQRLQSGYYNGYKALDFSGSNLKSPIKHDHLSDFFQIAIEEGQPENFQAHSKTTNLVQNLEYLNLNNKSIDKEMLGYIKHLKNLKILLLRNTGINNEDLLSFINELQQLQMVDLSENPINDAIERLSIPQLKILILADLKRSETEDSNFEDEMLPDQTQAIGFNEFPIAKPVQSQPKQLQFHHLENIGKLSRQLTYLDLSANDMVDKNIHYLNNFKNLKVLQLAANDITFKGEKKLGHFDHITWLDLSSNKMRSPQVVLDIRAKFPSLQHLNLSYNQFSDDAFKNLALLPENTEISFGLNRKLSRTIANETLLKLNNKGIRVLDWDEVTFKKEVSSLGKKKQKYRRDQVLDPTQENRKRPCFG